MCKKSNDPISRKAHNRWTDGQTNGERLIHTLGEEILAGRKFGGFGGLQNNPPN